MTDSKITPPPELVQKWGKAARGDMLNIAISAARWGYKQCESKYKPSCMKKLEQLDD
jgi:hypothetical protein